MAYSINAARCQILTVNGLINGQKIINRYHYAYFGVLPSPDTDDSATFLANFITMYRATILPVAWDDYTVQRYDLVEISGAILTPSVPHRYVTNIDPSKIDSVFGTVADKGAIASAGLVKIPTHECMRLKFNPQTRAPKRFRSNYARLSLGFPISSLAATAEQWSAGQIAAIGAAFTTMCTTAIFGQSFPAGSGYFPSAWSPPYFVNVVPVGVGNVRDACRKFLTGTVEPFVGTQITRRFFPLGGFRGV